MAWNDWTEEEQAEWGRIDKVRGELQDALHGPLDGLCLEYIAKGLPADEVLGTLILHLSGRLAGVAGIALAQDFTRRVHKEIGECESHGIPLEKGWHHLAAAVPYGTA